MTEEVKLELQQEEQVPEADPIEQRALEMGWRPKEEFDGDEVDFIDAKEFVRRKPLFEKIEHQSRELKAVRKALDAFKQHYTTVQKTEYEKALRDVKAAQKQALTDGDLDKYHALGEAKDQVELEARQALEAAEQIQVENPATPHPAFAQWVSRNPWYASQQHMRVYADEVGVRLAQAGVSPEEVLKQVEIEVRKEFPTKFRNPKKDDAPSVEGKSQTRGGSKASDNVELNDQERQIMNTLVRGGHITKEKYLADLKAAKGQK
jgi:type II secretory pathway component PulM